MDYNPENSGFPPLIAGARILPWEGCGWTRQRWGHGWMDPLVRPKPQADPSGREGARLRPGLSSSPRVCRSLCPCGKAAALASLPAPKAPGFWDFCLRLIAGMMSWCGARIMPGGCTCEMMSRALGQQVPCTRRCSTRDAWVYSVNPHMESARVALSLSLLSGGGSRCAGGWAGNIRSASTGYGGAGSLLWGRGHPNPRPSFDPGQHALPSETVRRGLLGGPLAHHAWIKAHPGAEHRAACRLWGAVSGSARRGAPSPPHLGRGGLGRLMSLDVTSEAGCCLICRWKPPNANSEGLWGPSKQGNWKPPRKVRGSAGRQPSGVTKVSPRAGHPHKKGKPRAEGSGCLGQNKALHPSTEGGALARGQAPRVLVCQSPLWILPWQRVS